MLNSFLYESVYFGVALSLIVYLFGVWVQKKTKSVLANPLLITVIVISLILVIFKIDYATFNYGAKYITFFLTPVTVCLAIPLYRQIEILKRNMVAILIGIFSGCIACAVTILLLSLAFKLPPEIYNSLLSKSVTTAIAIGITDELGGISAITIFAVMVTGLFGAVSVSFICKLVRIKNPIALGIACGNASHAVGTSRAMEIGELEGAMSSLSIVVAGIMTVVIAPLFSALYI